MKPALPQISGQFSLAERDKGLRDFLADRVSFYKGDHVHAEAVVEGTEFDEEPGIYFEDGRLTAYCTCDLYESGAFCRHIWTLLIAAGENQDLGTPAALPSIRLEHDDDGSNRDDLDQDDQVFQDEDFDSLVPRTITPPRRQPQPLSWKQRLHQVQPPSREFEMPRDVEFDQVVYFMLPERLGSDGRLTLHVGTRRRLKNGTWGTIQQPVFYGNEFSQLDLEDRRLVSLLLDSWSGDLRGGVRLTEEKFRVLLPMACATGRFFLAEHWQIESDAEPIHWEDEPWSFQIRLKKDGEFWVPNGALVRGEKMLEPRAAELIITCGFVFVQGRASPLLFSGSFDWLHALERQGEFRIPGPELEEFRREIYRLHDPPRIVWPDDSPCARLSPTPVPRLRVMSPKDGDHLHASLYFDYESIRVDSVDPRTSILAQDGKSVTERDMEAERRCRRLLKEVGLQKNYRFGLMKQELPYKLLAKKFPQAVCRLLSEGWQVEAEKILYKRPSSFQISVATGID